MAKHDYHKLMRQRFAELRELREEIVAKQKPLRDELRELNRDYKTKKAALAAKLRDVTAPLDEIDQELNGISRALVGKTGLNYEG